MMIIELGKQRTSNDLEKFLQVSMNVVGRSAFRQKKNIEGITYLFDENNQADPTWREVTQEKEYQRKKNSEKE